MNRIYSTFLIFSTIVLTIALGLVVYNEPDDNIEIAKEIYAEKLGIARPRPKRSQDFIPKEIREISQRFKNVEKNDARAFDSEISNAYFKLVAANKTLCDGVLLEVLNILAENDRPVMLVEFFKIANISEDSVLRAFACVKNPNLMSHITFKRARDLKKIKNFWQIAHAFERINYDFKNKDIAHIEDMFHYATMYGKGKHQTTYKASYPLVAFIAKYKGFDDIYKLYKEKSISDEQFDNLPKSVFEYGQFAIKIFALADEPDVALKLLDKLPESPNKNLVIKRVIRYILSAKGGIEAVKNSELGKLLEN